MSSAQAIEADPSGTEQLVETLAREAGVLGIEVASIAGTLEDLGGLTRRQREQLSSVASTMETLEGSNQAILDAANDAERQALEARGTMEQALADTRSLAESTARVAGSIGDVTQVLREVTNAASEINNISLQTRLVAFNASIEAARAGEAGRGSTVIAGAVKDLSERVERSSRLIIGTLSQLNERVAKLRNEVDGAGVKHQIDVAAAVEQTIATFGLAFDHVELGLRQISTRAADGLRGCTDTRGLAVGIALEAVQAANSVTAAAERSSRLLDLSERLIGLTADSGFETEDGPFIEKAIQTAAAVQAVFETAILKGSLSLDALFDKDYQPIAGSNPAQFLTRYCELTDVLLPPLQEEVLAFSPRVIFCAAVDTNGYLPTHNRKFSHPQGEDPVWNAAHCRNRRIFSDRTGLGAGRNQKRFLLQTYRRDMGGGQYRMMKDASAPIFVRGRHWGGLRVAYLID